MLHEDFRYEMVIKLSRREMQCEVEVFLFWSMTLPWLFLTLRHTL